MADGIGRPRQTIGLPLDSGNAGSPCRHRQQSGSTWRKASCHRPPRTTVSSVPTSVVGWQRLAARRLPLMAPSFRSRLSLNGLLPSTEPTLWPHRAPGISTSPCRSEKPSGTRRSARQRTSGMPRPGSTFPRSSWDGAGWYDTKSRTGPRVAPRAADSAAARVAL
jgi:hypothetical protein